ncbi:MAG: FAD:protein FMN transferase [Verrucomicrobiales bacterium]
MIRALFIGLLVLLFAGALVWKTRAPKPNSPMNGSAMGTSWTLAWRGDAPKDLRKHIAGVLEHWEQTLSQWRADSDLSQFNRGKLASPDLQRVLDLAESIRTASGGAFDHRILADVHAAGYGPSGNGVDLSAIGKGFAVDRVGEKLRSIGMHDFVFELGGEVLAGDGEWAVEIERPQNGKREISRHLTLRKRALATSGNYHQPGHLIDPRTHQPVQRPPCSVSVLADDCATADAWATALFVLGPDFRDYPKDLEVTWRFATEDTR